MEIIVRIAHCARKEMSSVWSGACYFYLAIVMVIPVRWNKATANESKCKWTITKHHKSAWMFPPTIHFPSFKIILQISLSLKKNNILFRNLWSNSNKSLAAPIIPLFLLGWNWISSKTSSLRSFPLFLGGVKINILCQSVAASCVTYSKAKDKRQRIAARLKLYGRFMLYFRCYIIQIKLNNLSASRGASSLPSAHLKANALPPQGIGKAPCVYVVCKTSQFSCFLHTLTYVCLCTWVAAACVTRQWVNYPFFCPASHGSTFAAFILRPWNGF